MRSQVKTWVGVVVQRVVAATTSRLGPFSSCTYVTSWHRSSESSSRRFSCRAGRSTSLFLLLFERNSAISNPVDEYTSAEA